MLISQGTFHIILHDGLYLELRFNSKFGAYSYLHMLEGLQF